MGETTNTSERQQTQTRLWLNVLRLHGLVFADLNKQLQDETGLSLAKFDAMAQLARHPEGLSMGQLSGALKVSNGNVSGLVNRLIKDGMVTKSMSSEDRRSFSANLTEAGQATFNQASEAHNRILATQLRGLTDDELQGANTTLRALLETIQSGMDID